MDVQLCDRVLVIGIFTSMITTVFILARCIFEYIKSRYRNPFQSVNPMYI